MDGDRVTTTIVVPTRIWKALRQLAEQRAETEGGRPSASAVVAELVEAAAKKPAKPEATR